jgi:hypothetical protein
MSDKSRWYKNPTASVHLNNKADFPAYQPALFLIIKIAYSLK